jgi:DNA polymerase-3 subunit gamma/tau
MEHFVVSARKYRPQHFGTVIGQSHITTTLKNAISSNQLAHAFLFCGPRGVGKTTCARILAKTINCESRTKDGEACNKCQSCQSFDNGSSFNIHELDAASNNSVDDIRVITEQVRFAPQAGRYKVYIVDEVHMLSSAAFNAFLKTLEEPPAHAIFILATTEKHKILPTILSRCQIFDFKRITTQDTVDHLEDIVKKEKIKAEKTALHIIAQKSEGCLRDALSILDKIVSFTGGNITYSNTLEHLNILDEDYYFKLMDQMQQQQLAEAILTFDDINQKGFEGDTLIEGFAEFIRNVLICKDERTLKLLDVAEDFKPKYKSCAENTDTGWLIGALNILTENAISYKQAKNKKLHVELLLIKLTYLKQAVTLASSGESLSKKKTTELTKSVSFRALTPILAHQKTVPKKQVEEKAKLIIESPEIVTVKKEITKPQPEPIAAPQVIPEVPKIASLSKIRNKIHAEKEKQAVVQTLEAELLSDAWKTYQQNLENESKHTAASNFGFARLEIMDATQFTVVCDSLIQQKFIESERAGLISFIHQFFNNTQILFQFRLEEPPPSTETENLPVNSKEHFQQLSAQYPMLKMLKETLHLDLDF